MIDDIISEGDELNGLVLWNNICFFERSDAYIRCKSIMQLSKDNIIRSGEFVLKALMALVLLANLV